ncbi:MAG: hypothetical protein QW491_10080 [Thermoproteota archaeon]
MKRAYDIMFSGSTPLFRRFASVIRCNCIPRPSSEYTVVDVGGGKRELVARKNLFAGHVIAEVVRGKREIVLAAFDESEAERQEIESFGGVFRSRFRFYDEDIDLMQGMFYDGDQIFPYYDGDRLAGEFLEAVKECGGKVAVALDGEAAEKDFLKLLTLPPAYYYFETRLPFNEEGLRIAEAFPLHLNSLERGQIVMAAVQGDSEVHVIPSEPELGEGDWIEPCHDENLFRPGIVFDFTLCPEDASVFIKMFPLNSYGILDPIQEKRFIKTLAERVPKTRIFAPEPRTT